jgi:O-antigen/teichoic acid export membrane protein
MGDERIKRNLLTSAGKLATGIYGSSAIGLVSLAITARALTPDEFGSLVLIIAYVAMVEQVVSFQSWQAYVKFGSEAIARNSYSRLLNITRYCAGMEGASLVAGACLGVALAFFMSYWIDWLREYRIWAAAYSLTILARFTGISTGVLRLERAFGVQAATTFATAVIRLICILVASLMGSGLKAFFFAWLICEVIGGLGLALVAVIVFSRRKDRNLLPPRGHLTFHPDTKDQAELETAFSADDRRDIRAFMWTTNIEGTIRAIRSGDIPIIGSVLGPEGAGLYAIARRIAGMLALLVEASVQTIYPDIANLVAKGKHHELRSIMVYASMLIGGIGLLVVGVFAVAGDWVIHLLLPPAYGPVVSATSLCLLGALVWAFAHPLWPALLALSKTTLLTVAQAFASIGHIALTFVLAKAWGLEGAAIAFIALQIIWGVWLWTGYRYARRNFRDPQAGVK